jgi:hypothetical protein
VKERILQAPRPVSHKEYTVLDGAKGEQVCTNLISHTRFPAPPDHEWLMVFDPVDGSGVLTHAASTENVESNIIDLDDLMTEKLYEADGEYYTKLDKAWEELRPLDGGFAERTDCEVTLQVGSTNAKVTLTGHIMKKPRDCGLHIYFAMGQVFDLFRMTSHSGKRGNWVEATLPRWEKAPRRLCAAPSICLLSEGPA